MLKFFLMIFRLDYTLNNEKRKCFANNDYLFWNSPYVGETFPKDNENFLGTTSQSGSGAIESGISRAKDDHVASKRWKFLIIFTSAHPRFAAFRDNGQKTL